MPKPVRAWKIIRSVELALVIGSLAGLIAAGLFRNRVVGTMDPLAALWLGIGVAVVLTAVLTYVFDQVSQGVANVKRSANAKISKSRWRKR
jgi:hypothetical protein